MYGYEEGPREMEGSTVPCVLKMLIILSENGICTTSARDRSSLPRNQRTRTPGTNLILFREKRLLLKEMFVFSAVRGRSREFPPITHRSSLPAVPYTDHPTSQPMQLSPCPAAIKRASITMTKIVAQHGPPSEQYSSNTHIYTIQYVSYL